MYIAIHSNMFTQTADPPTTLQ